MNEHLVTSQPIVTEEDLRLEGFTPEQIQRLVALRDCYPLIEFITQRADRERLAFLRWCYRTGRIAN